MVVRFVVLLLSLGLALFSPAGSAMAQTPRVCLDDSQAALGQFAQFHELATRALLRSRSVSLEPKRFDNLAADAERYLDEREGTALLVYAWDEDDLCLFLWSWALPGPDHRLYVRLSGAKRTLIRDARLLSELAQAQTSLAAGRLPRKRAMTALDPPEAPSGDITAVTAELSALLFPLELHGALREARELAIVPVGPIATTPLFMLRPFGDERVTAELFAVNILTLMEDIQEPSSASSRTPRNVLIVGNPTARDEEWDFPDLPGAEAEARFAHGLLGGTMLTREEATLARFEELAPDADLIVLAAHGVADAEAPLDGSFLALADGRLVPRYIQSLMLDGRPLVVLSACQSGLGRALDAGVVGLARAFQLAGASNTVMSLWSVDDDATRFLMEHFYRLLAEHEPAEALRLATLSTRERFPHPGQWASFAVFGGP
ncbi:MAG: CHAT domain-containing protein [Parvibaculaceae bacterium]